MSDYENSAGEDWPGWQNLDKAIEAFLGATSSALEILKDFSVAKPIVVWLGDEADSEVEDYQERLENCRDDLSAALDLVANLRDEAESFSETLTFLDDVEGEMEEQLGESASDEVKESISEFIVAKLEPVRETGWHLYHVMIQAA